MEPMIARFLVELVPYAPAIYIPWCVELSRDAADYDTVLYCNVTECNVPYIPCAIMADIMI